MSLIELFLLAVCLSMDAFAVSVGAGLTMQKPFINKAMVFGLYFGAFQAIMPLIGYFTATMFAEKVIAYDHWIALLLLCFLGGKMVVGSFKKEGRTRDERGATLCGAYKGDGDALIGDKREDVKSRAGKSAPFEHNPTGGEASVKPGQMLPLALATSIDALAVGVSFAFLRVNAVPAVIFIGVTTFAISIAGVKIGNVFGSRFKTKAELAGGVILILIGLKIFLEHIL